MKKYSIIYADPPWKFKSANSGGSMKSGAANKYAVMSHQDICRLPVRTIAAENCVLFMWWVGSQPREALAVVDSWGFEIRTMLGFNWFKQTKTGKPFFGMGYQTRQGSECCLIATIGKPKRVSASVRSVLLAPATTHSRKPEEIRTRIVGLYGDLPRIELFARERVFGWDAWGMEIVSDIDL